MNTRIPRRFPTWRTFLDAIKRIKKVKALVLVVSLGLGIWYQIYSNVGLPTLGNICSSDGDDATSHSLATRWFYGPLMQLRYHAPALRSVRLLSLKPSELSPNLFSNPCDGRKFLTVLIPVLAAQHARTIVIDRYFSAGACDDDDPDNRIANDAFRAALNGAGVPPVVVGQRTREKEGNATDEGDCVVLVQPFDFHQRSTGTSTSTSTARDNVSTGLTLLNSDLRKIPLSWWVLPTPDPDRPDGEKAKRTPGLAFAALQQSDPDVAADPYLAQLDERNEHPFGAFAREVPETSALDVLCESGQASVVIARKWGTCVGRSQVPLLLSGKIVVVGDENPDTDLHSFGSTQLYGAQLQANYIEALLQNRYVHPVRAKWDWMLVVLAFLITGIIEIAESEQWWGFTQRRAVWANLCLLLCLAAFGLMMFSIGYLAPLLFLAFVGICINIGLSLKDLLKNFGRHAQ